MKRFYISALLLTALLTASCGDSTAGVTEESDTADTQQTEETTAAVTEDVRAPYADQAPRIEDFDGYEFRIFVHDGTKYDSDEETGEIVNDAIHRYSPTPISSRKPAASPTHGRCMSQVTILSQLCVFNLFFAEK